MTITDLGVDTGGKPINLAQLQDELEVAGVDCSAGLGMHDGAVYTYDTEGQFADFPAAEQATVDQVIAEHVAVREKTNEEYAAEFQDAATPAPRKQQINHIVTGLMPRETVPMT